MPRSGAPKRHTDLQRLTVMVERETLKLLAARAKDEDRTVSSIIRRALRASLESK